MKLALVTGATGFVGANLVAALTQTGWRVRVLHRPSSRLHALDGLTFEPAPLLTDLHHEEFWVLLLNKANEVFSRERLSTGGMSGTVVDVKMLFKVALDARAAAVIAIHNHPSGSLQPSQADIDLTSRLRKAGELLDLALLDHLIVSERGYYSFADEGML